MRTSDSRRPALVARGEAGRVRPVSGLEALQAAAGNAAVSQLVQTLTDPTPPVSAGGASRRPVQPRRPAVRSAALLLGPVPVARSLALLSSQPVQRQPVGAPLPQGKPMGVAGVVDQDNPHQGVAGKDRLGEGTRLLDRPDGTTVGHLADNTRLTVVEEVPGGWYRVLTHGGRDGYVNRSFVSLPPGGDVEAELYRITQKKDNLGLFRLLSAKYGPFEERALTRLKLGDWGWDARFYARVLKHLNTLPGVNRDWVKGPFRKKKFFPGTGGLFGSVGHYRVVEDWTMLAGGRIFLPGKTYADTLHGTVSSGSSSYEAKRWVVDKAKLVWSIIREIPPFTAGVVVGAGEHLVNIVTDLLEMVWGLVKSIITGNILDDAKALILAIWDMVKSPRKVFEAIAEGLKRQWDAGWYSRGKLFGALLAEVVVMVLTAGSSGLVRAPAWVKKVLDLVKGTKVAKYLDRTIGAAEKAGAKTPDRVRDTLRKTDSPRLREWAQKRLSLVAETMKDLSDDALRLLQRLPEWAMEQLSKLNKWAQRACLGCASPCNVDLDKVIKALAAAPVADGKKLARTDAIIDALPLNWNPRKLLSRLGEGSPLLKLIKEAGLTDNELLQLRRMVNGSNIVDSAEAYKTLVRFVTNAAAVKISDINRLRKLLDDLHVGKNLSKVEAKVYAAMGRSLKGSVFESWCRTHLAKLRGTGFERRSWTSVRGVVKLAKGKRTADLWDPANGAIWDFKYSSKVDPVQSGDYRKLLAASKVSDKMNPKVKEVNYVFPSKEFAESAGVGPPIKVWYVDNAGAARQLVPLTVP